MKYYITFKIILLRQQLVLLQCVVSNYRFLSVRTVSVWFHPVLQLHHSLFEIGCYCCILFMRNWQCERRSTSFFCQKNQTAIQIHHVLSLNRFIQQCVKNLTCKNLSVLEFRLLQRQIKSIHTRNRKAICDVIKQN